MLLYECIGFGIVNSMCRQKCPRHAAASALSELSLSLHACYTTIDSDLGHLITDNNSFTCVLIVLWQVAKEMVNRRCNRAWPGDHIFTQCNYSFCSTIRLVTMNADIVQPLAVIKSLVCIRMLWRMIGARSWSWWHNNKAPRRQIMSTVMDLEWWMHVCTTKHANWLQPLMSIDSPIKVL